MTSQIVETPRGRALPYFGMVGRFRDEDPFLFRFFYSFSAEKIGLSLSHLVPEILGPKTGLICHQNILLSILYEFSP